MPAVEKLLRDIHTLRESIQIDWEELYANPLRDQERRDLHKHIKLCNAELKVLLERLSKLDDELPD
jgi:hypothetical protein